MWTKIRSLVFFVLIVLAISFGFWRAMSLLSPLGYPFDDARFSRKLWLSVDGNGECVRGTMVDDLIDEHLGKGMRKEDVTELLGKYSEADTTHWGLPADVKSVWTFPVGACSGFKVDCDYLAIAFDAQGRLIQAWHYQS